MATVDMNDKTGEDIRVWALLGPHRGDNNQILALAEALGLPFEQKWLRYNQLRRVQPGLLGATFGTVAAVARAQLEGEPPDLTISTGLRSVPVVRELRRRSGGKMRAVHLGYPRVSPSHFDLVVPTPEYPVPDAPNVVLIPFALSPLAKDAADPAEVESIAGHAPPPPAFRPWRTNSLLGIAGKRDRCVASTADWDHRPGWRLSPRDRQPENTSASTLQQ